MVLFGPSGRFKRSTELLTDFKLVYRMVILADPRGSEKRFGF